MCLPRGMCGCGYVRDTSCEFKWKTERFVAIIQGEKGSSGMETWHDWKAADPVGDGKVYADDLEVTEEDLRALFVS